MPLKAILAKRKDNPDEYHMGLAFLGWFMVFSVGMLVPSQPFRDFVVSVSKAVYQPRASAAQPAGTGGPATTPATPPEGDRASAATASALALPNLPRGMAWHLPLAVGSLVASMVVSTPTNLVLLCVFGAMMGAYALRLHGQQRAAQDRAARSGMTAPDPLPIAFASPGASVPAAKAILHGVCVFLGIVGGLIVVQGDLKFDVDAPTLYLRVAGIATLFSVIAGANPNFIRDISRLASPFKSSDDRRDRPDEGGSPQSPTPVTK
ncbi:MAG: hypothetical protein SFZ23_11360 [Planctomycetota bacterium]|nr:hypothetical protein [Planctomycetota bacterium]